MASIIDGKAVAKEVQKHIKEEVEGLERRWGLVPGLGVGAGAQGGRQGLP